MMGGRPFRRRRATPSHTPHIQPNRTEPPRTLYMSTPRSVTITRSWLFPPWSLQSIPPGRIEQGSSTSSSPPVPPPPSASAPLSAPPPALESRRLGEAGLFCPRSPQLTLPPPVVFWFWGWARFEMMAEGLMAHSFDPDG